MRSPVPSNASYNGLVNTLFKNSKSKTTEDYTCWAHHLECVFVLDTLSRHWLMSATVKPLLAGFIIKVVSAKGAPSAILVEVFYFEHTKVEAIRPRSPRLDQVHLSVTPILCVKRRVFLGVVISITSLTFSLFFSFSSHLLPLSLKFTEIRAIFTILVGPLVFFTVEPLSKGFIILSLRLLGTHVTIVVESLGICSFATLTSCLVRIMLGLLILSFTVRVVCWASACFFVLLCVLKPKKITFKAWLGRSIPLLPRVLLWSLAVTPVLSCKIWIEFEEFFLGGVVSVVIFLSRAASVRALVCVAALWGVKLIWLWAWCFLGSCVVSLSLVFVTKDLPRGRDAFKLWFRFLTIPTLVRVILLRKLVIGFFYLGRIVGCIYSECFV